MSLPDQTPKLPKLPFLVGDAALLATAWYLVHQSPGPLTVNTVAAVTACVALGAVLGAVPFLADYARKQDEALDERQRGLEALAGTITAAAEQISIAASGLHQLTEGIHKNVKHAEQLPHKLQEKIAEFNAQLDNAREDDREELEKELAELRASESDRLEATAEKIHKAAAELTKLDAAAQKQIAARMDLLQRTSDTLAQVHTDTSTALTDASTAALRDLAAAQSKALAEIDARLEARTAASLSAIEAALAKAAAQPIGQVPSEPSANAPTAALAADSTGAEVASPPKRPRKARREDSASEESTTPETAAPSPSPPELSSAVEDAPAELAAIADAPLPPPSVAPPESEPAPVPLDSISKIEPVAPPSADPFALASAATDLPTAPVEASPAPAQTSTESKLDSSGGSEAATSERRVKKRTPKKTGDEPISADAAPEAFSLSSEDDPPVTSGEAIERVISSDGATRLIATAYIGIGNRLFIRGDGPGLSWEKGIPLQFVSIGKWRWETADATAPIMLKLYKNDETECAALGTLTLEPGHQQEVTAKF